MGDTSGHAFTGPYGTVFSPDYVDLRPFIEPWSVSVLRYVVPVAGTYAVKGAFIGHSVYGPSTDVHVLFDNESALGASITGGIGEWRGLHPAIANHNFFRNEGVRTS